MPSPRPLVSGRDFQLRYALHRLTLLALRRDPLHARAARARLEWPLLVSGREVWTDVVIEDAERTILEIIECKEHEAHLDRRSIASFLEMVSTFGATPAFADVTMRFVSNARFLDDGSDFARAAMRIRAYQRLRQLLGDSAPAAPSGLALMDLLVFADAFRGTGQPGMTRAILLENLRGLHVGERANFHGAFFVGADFTGCRMSSAVFGQANLSGVTVADSHFHRSSFALASFAAIRARDSCFEQCDFSAAEVAFGEDEDTPAVRINFRGAKFDRAVINCDLEDSTLTGNTWKGATVKATLTRCVLDRAAHDFFVTHDAKLTDCTLV
ncbi:MAG TPA: pentapeptide repeat-containing protein [Thermoanaerobaculia bacterium]|jgi:uncharacterized protein YjbI with pentapeptide repeats